MDTTIVETAHIPKVSIGMPVYNGEPFIREALDSLLAQTFTDFELIISDNASTDKTEQICREYAAKDKRIRYIRQEINRGAAANFQYVLDEAVGEYFMWAAADDLWDSEFILKLIPLVERENIVLAFSGWVEIDENNNQKIFSNQIFLNLDYSSPCFFIYKKSLIKYIFQNWNTGKVNIIYGLIKRSLLVKSNAIKKWGDFGFAGDHYIMIELLKYGDIKLSKDYLFYKRSHSQNSGTTLSSKKSERRSIYIIMMGVLNSIYLHYKYAINIWKPLIINKKNILNIIFAIIFTLFEFTRISFYLIKILIKASFVKLNFRK